jgi:tight adherence protein C
MNLLNNPDFISIVAGLGAFATVVLLWIGLIEKDNLASRLKSVTDRRHEFIAERREKKQQKNSQRAKLQRLGLMKQVVNALKMAQGKSVDGLRLKLKRAGYHSRDATFVYLFSKLAMLVGLAALALFFIFVLKAVKLEPALGLLIALVAAALGWVLPDVFLKNQSQKREDVLRKGMPDALDLLVICAEAGLGLNSAFDRVAREIGQNSPELAEEIGLTSVELNFLPNRAQALQGLAERVQLPGVLALVNTLIQTEKYGTPLAQALRVLSAEMREERMMKAEEKAAKLPAILTVPMIIFILPPLFVVLIGPAVIKVMDAMKGG